VDLEVFAPLTPADVVRAESVLGVRLPSEYVELLQVQNGGYISHDFDAFPTTAPTSWADDHVWFRTLAGIGPADSWPSVTMSAALAAEWGMPGGLVLLGGDGHFWIALDYRDRAPVADPSVVWFDTEVGEDLTLAPSFRAFIEGLRPMESFGVDEPVHDRVSVADAADGVGFVGTVDVHADFDAEAGDALEGRCAQRPAAVPLNHEIPAEEVGSGAGVDNGVEAGPEGLEPVEEPRQMLVERGAPIHDAVGAQRPEAGSVGGSVAAVREATEVALPVRSRRSEPGQLGDGAGIEAIAHETKRGGCTRRRIGADE
jgi:hypothetical protein